MPRRIRAAGLGVIITLAVMALVEFAAMRAGTLGIVIVGVAAGLALVVFLTAADLVKVGMGATFLSAFTLTWNGWYVGPVRPGDVLPLLALVAFGVAVPSYAFRAPPWWIKQLVIGLIVLLVAIVLFPTSQHYLNSRLVVDAGGNGVHPDYTGFATQNVGIIAKFIVAIAFIPIAFAAAALVDRRAVRWLSIAFCVGTALSGLVAFTDHLGYFNLSHFITRINATSDRTAGFSTHPNFLAETLVLAAPFACWLITSRIRWERLIGIAALVSCLLGSYASGSRGGNVCIIIAIALAFVLIPRTRPHTPTILLMAVAAVGVVAVIFPSFGLQILRVTRLYGNPNTEGSNTVRDWVADQGWKDFIYSPIKGIGMQSSTDASQVYLQQLAAGGLILFGIMTIYLVGAAWASFRMIPRTPIAAAICAGVITKVPMNFVETSLTDRLYYVQEAILVAAIAVLAKERDRATSDAFDPAYVPPQHIADAESGDPADTPETPATPAAPAAPERAATPETTNPTMVTQR